nr:WASH complex subunit 3-like isoform X2 [Plodia interpunctella]
MYLVSNKSMLAEHISYLLFCTTQNILEMFLIKSPMWAFAVLLVIFIKSGEAQIPLMPMMPAMPPPMPPPVLAPMPPPMMPPPMIPAPLIPGPPSIVAIFVSGNDKKNKNYKKHNSAEGGSGNDFENNDERKSSNRERGTKEFFPFPVPVAVPMLPPPPPPPICPMMLG